MEHVKVNGCPPVKNATNSLRHILGWKNTISTGATPEIKPASPELHHHQGLVRLEPFQSLQILLRSTLKVDRQKNWEKEKQTNRKRKTDRQTDRQRDRQTQRGRQTVRQTEREINTDVANQTKTDRTTD